VLSKTNEVGPNVVHLQICALIIPLISYASDVLMIDYNAIHSLSFIACSQFHKKSSFFGFGQFHCNFEFVLVSLLSSKWEPVL
jgi:hypothetical protein